MKWLAESRCFGMALRMFCRFIAESKMLAAIMKHRKLKIISGLISALLLISLLIKLTTVPGGMILSGLFLSSMYLVIVLIFCLVLSFFIKQFLQTYSFLSFFFITTSIALIAFHYQLYSPTLKIVVPDGYTGEVNLVLSNVDENILTIDSNGIGYLNKWTFNKLYSKPEVYTVSGKNIDSLCVGFNPSTFFGFSKFCCVDKKIIRSKSFDISVDSFNSDKIFASKGFSQFIDTKKL
ncbi:MAG: hypothetical protein JWP69_2215 [Flaviaesturariibacter sp.]|nr:hypothetical protein [Flaviaesturariibacter sp.]